MKSVFHDWDISSLQQVLSMANSCGRSYGTFDELSEQYKTLNIRYSELHDSYSEMQRWMMICKKKELYKDVGGILHFALCCFVKSPLEATAESVGSVINHHGRKSRCSLSPSSLASEVQIAWNSPHEFSAAATKLVNKSVDEYFKGNKNGVRFYVVRKLKTVSSTIKTHMEKPSRIKFG